MRSAAICTAVDDVNLWQSPEPAVEQYVSTNKESEHHWAKFT